MRNEGAMQFFIYLKISGTASYIMYIAYFFNVADEDQYFRSLIYPTKNLIKKNLIEQVIL